MSLKLYLYVHTACRCMCDVVEKLVFVKRLVFSGQRSQSRRGAVSAADLCSWHSAQAETPTHVKCHSTNFFPMQPRYNRRGERQTHLIAPQNEIPRRLCNSQICRLYFNEIHSILSLLFCARLYCMLILGILGGIFVFIHLYTGTVHINNYSENMPEIARKAHFHL